jgi:hypothetical protein
MGDTFALHQMLAAGARSAVIVDGGYIGLEMAEAFGATLRLTLNPRHTPARGPDG